MPFFPKLAFFRPGRSRRVKGCYLLRNYKASHRGRVERAIRLAGVAEVISISDVAYGETGVLPEKIAVFCKKGRPEAETLFFQFYHIAKAEEQRNLSPSAHLV